MFFFIYRYITTKKTKVDTLFSNAGGGAVFAGSEIQKIFLDVHTSRAHVANNPVSFSRNYGAMQLGVENTDYFV